MPLIVQSSEYAPLSQRLDEIVRPLASAFASPLSVLHVAGLVALSDGKRIALSPSARYGQEPKKGNGMTKKVADLLVDVLAEAGVRRIYGVVGDSLNGITDSIRVKNNLEWVHVRHEEVAAFAAGAEAHLTGTLAVCAGSCGPGNMHLINGLYDCQRNRVPVLAIAAHIPSREIGSDYFQETDPKHIFAQCSHYCELVSDPEQMPRILETAIQTAISKRGVSVIVLPGDVALKDAVQGPRVRFHEQKSALCPSDEELNVLAELLNRAEKITILGGAGCAGAHAELMEVAGKLQAPIVHAYRGKEFIEYDNPFDVGMTGLLGFSSGYYAMMNCEILLMIGTDFPYRDFYPKDATIVQIDLRGEQLGRRTKVDYGIVGDTKATLRAYRSDVRSGQSSLLTLAVSLLPKKIRNVCPTSQRFDEPFPVHIIPKHFLPAITTAHQVINGSVILNT